MKNLHIFTKDENQKFSIDFIKFIDENFSIDEHFFLILGKGGSNNHNLKNTLFLNFGIMNILYLLKFVTKSKQVYLHGLFSPYVLLTYFLYPIGLKKCHWLVWGGDLYYYQFRTRNIKTSIYEWFRKKVIKRMGYIITHIEGDYELAKRWYNTKAEYQYSFLYPSNLYKKIEDIPFKEIKNVKYIQVGNSACRTNNHIEVFKKISKFENIIVICPLSYSGDLEYIELVKKEGLMLLGESRFKPLLDFIPYKEYLQLLGEIDIAIFNHRRQRAVGNITSLLGMGKKVYIRNDITTWAFCEKNNLEVFNANSDFNDLLEEFDDSKALSNVENIKRNFSIEKLKNDWQIIFNKNY